MSVLLVIEAVAGEPSPNRNNSSSFQFSIIENIITQEGNLCDLEAVHCYIWLDRFLQDQKLNCLRDWTWHEGQALSKHL
jgi:hypothetical protein